MFQAYKAQLMLDNTSCEDLVLEIGCGKKHYEKVCKGFYIGLDISHKPDVKADGQFLPFRSGVFTKIIMLDLIEHVQSCNRLLRECYRVIKKEGKLYLTTPNSIGFGFWDSYIDRSHTYHFTAKTLKLFLRINGFKVVKEIPLELHTLLKFLNKIPLKFLLVFQQSLAYEAKKLFN